MSAPTVRPCIRPPCGRKFPIPRVKLSHGRPRPKGEHGGKHQSRTHTYYRIVRQPDNRVLTEKKRAQIYCTDNVPADLMRRYWYEITACYRNIEGATAQTGRNRNGTAHTHTIPADIRHHERLQDFRGARQQQRQIPSRRGIWGWYEEKEVCRLTNTTLSFPAMTG